MEEIYGPEDIEKLLLSKDFSALYPEERAYVLKHMEDEDEYTSMRMMLIDVSEADDVLTAPKSMRDDLLAMHESRHSKPSFKIWLNSLFSSLTPSIEWRRPAMQLAGVAGLILIVTVTFRFLAPELGSKDLTDNPKKTEEIIRSKKTISESNEVEAPTTSPEPSKPATQSVENKTPKLDISDGEQEKNEPSTIITDAAIVVERSVEELALDNAPVMEAPTSGDHTVMEDEISNYQDLESPLIQAEEQVDDFVYEYQEETKVIDDEYRNDSDKEAAMGLKKDKAEEHNVTVTSASTEMGAARTQVDSNADMNSSFSPPSVHVPSALLSHLVTAW